MSVFVVADPGADHLGSLSRMLRLFDAAKEAGADAIKPQLYRADTLYHESREDLRAIVRPYEIPLEWLAPMKEYADGIGIEFMCSAFAVELYRAVDPYVKRHKVASLEAGDYQLVQYVLGFRKPTLISLGASDSADHDAYGCFDQVTLMQCTTSYPAPIADAGLGVIGKSNIRGFSDHTRSMLAGAVAVARGAVVIEKHLRLDDGLSGGQPDYAHSFTPGQMKHYVEHIREAEVLLGSSQKRVTESEAALASLRRKPGKLRGEAA